MADMISGATQASHRCTYCGQGFQSSVTRAEVDGVELVFADDDETRGGIGEFARDIGGGDGGFKSEERDAE